MRIYISGAVTGYENAEEEFEKAEQYLKELGYTDVVNPLKVCSMLPKTFVHGEYMSVCYRLIDLCQGVYMLPNWLNSTGATFEYHYAIAHEKKIILP